MALARFWWLLGHLAEGRAQLEELLGLCSVGAGPGRAAGQSASHAREQPVRQLHGGRLDRGTLSLGRGFGDLPAAGTRAARGRPSYRISAASALHSASGWWRTLPLKRALRSCAGWATDPALPSRTFTWALSIYFGATSRRRAPTWRKALGSSGRWMDKFWVNGCMVYLGYIDCEEGHHATARSRFVEMNEILPLVQAPWGSPYWLEGFARLASAEGQAARALRLGGATAALRRTYGMSIGLAEQAAFERGLERAWQALGEEEGKAAWEEGRAMTLEEALAFALENPVEEPAAKPETKLGQTSGGLLSTREVEVLSLVAEGLTDAEVAGRLYVSPRTVGGHLRGAYGKLGVKSRIAAINEAQQLGLI